MPIAAIKEFFRLESAAGLMLVAAAALALVVENFGLAFLYDAILTTQVSISVGALAIDKPLLLWINDGLMAVFFLLIGLEVKREILDGELSRPDQLVLPIAGAIGGIVVPVAIYLFINQNGDPVAMRGWAIPAATDIAFALGILSLLGPRVPLALKVLLATIAIVDDLAAILIIAAFYTANLSVASLALAAVALVGLAVLNRMRVTALAPYILIGIVLWVCVLKSGVHATLAGVALGFAIPLRARDQAGHSPLRHLEHMLHPWVAFGVLPVFAFANAGLPLAGLSLTDLASPMPLGIALGLFIGKQLGVFGVCALAIKLGLARLPDAVNWGMLYGMSVLTGIGFTMSLFIGGLAFDDPASANAIRLGILLGSLASALLGYVVLKRACGRVERPVTA